MLIKEDQNNADLTEEMISAGVLALSEYDSRFEFPDGVVCRIWRAMNSAKKPILPNPVHPDSAVVFRSENSPNKS
jgi:hypothetical protein